jgi:hypothetical protein
VNFDENRSNWRHNLPHPTGKAESAPL